MAEAPLSIESDSDDVPISALAADEDDMPIDMVCAKNPKGHDGSSFE
jgi:hypothetical protein